MPKKRVKVEAIEHDASTSTSETKQGGKKKSKVPTNEEENKEVAAVQQTPNESKYTAIICFNCGNKGHRFRTCTEKRRTFCYRCGEKDVKSTDCAKYDETLNELPSGQTTRGLSNECNTKAINKNVGTFAESGDGSNHGELRKEVVKAGGADISDSKTEKSHKVLTNIENKYASMGRVLRSGNVYDCGRIRPPGYSSEDTPSVSVNVVIEEDLTE
ncbi:hypothetical protein PV327_011182, partial [Microctonus hyperodae]